MKLNSINIEQRLYVIDCGKGYSCYGFSVLDHKARAVAQWANLDPPPAPLGTVAHFEACSRIMRAGADHAAETASRCPADLTPQLIGLEGRRVEVTDSHGERRRFKVGRSTGWLPCHLQLANARSSGGIGVMGAPFESVRVVR